MTKTLFSIVIFTSLCIAQSPSRLAPLPQIQSPSLRIEFDKQMRSRVVARFNGKEVPLGAFSASETVKGSERAWYDFVLESQKQEHVSDVYGGGEKLTLTGTSGQPSQEPLRHYLRRLSQSCSIRCQLHEYWQVATEDSRMEQQ